MIFQQETVKFPLRSGDGKFFKEGDFRYGNITAGILLPCSVYISDRFLCDPAWKRSESTEKITVSDRILQDSVTEIIDLGDCLEIQYNR
jgi:hypothetical protein